MIYYINYNYNEIIYSSVIYSDIYLLLNCLIFIKLMNELIN